MKTAVVFDLCRFPASLRMACDINLAWSPTWESPISPSISARGTRAAGRRDCSVCAALPIADPKDLEGRKVGVRAYAVTAAVWTRGILADEYGVDLDRITWMTEEDENVQTFPLPSNVRRIDAGQSLAAMLKGGEIEAAFAGLAGAGDGLDDALVELIGDAAERERDWYRRTGIYPLHGVIVVRDGPATPSGAAGCSLRGLRRGKGELPRTGFVPAWPAGAEDKRYPRLAELVGDPLPYGLEANAASFEALACYAHRQYLIPAMPAIESIVLDPRARPAPQRSERSPPRWLPKR